MLCLKTAAYVEQKVGQVAVEQHNVLLAERERQVVNEAEYRHAAVVQEMSDKLRAQEASMQAITQAMQN